MSGTCFLCNRPCETPPSGPYDGNYYECPSCGDYAVSRTAHTVYGGENYQSDRDKLSHLAAERNIHQQSGFCLCTEDRGEIQLKGKTLACLKPETILKDYPKTNNELIDRTLLNFSKLSTFPGKAFTIEKIHVGELVLPDRSLTFCTNCEDCVQYLVFLKSAELIQYDGISDSKGNKLSDFETACTYRQLNQIPLIIAPKGLDRIDSLRRHPESNLLQIFVAMWFAPSRNEYYEVMEKAICANGYKSKRIDQVEHNNKICDEIVAEIRRSRCVIADFTGQRGGVYFEAGYAMGLGIPVIWAVEKSDVNNLHFDTRQYAHIVYDSTEDLQKKLKDRIAATLPVIK